MFFLKKIPVINVSVLTSHMISNLTAKRKKDLPTKYTSEYLYRPRGRRPPSTAKDERYSTTYAAMRLSTRPRFDGEARSSRFPSGLLARRYKQKTLYSIYIAILGSMYITDM